MSAEGRGAQTGFSDAAWLATMTDNTEHVDVQPQRCSSSAAGASRLGGVGLIILHPYDAKAHIKLALHRNLRLKLASPSFT